MNIQPLHQTSAQAPQSTADRYSGLLFFAPVVMAVACTAFKLASMQKEKADRPSLSTLRMQPASQAAAKYPNLTEIPSQDKMLSLIRHPRKQAREDLSHLHGKNPFRSLKALKAEQDKMLSLTCHHLMQAEQGLPHLHGKNPFRSLKALTAEQEQRLRESPMPQSAAPSSPTIALPAQQEIPPSAPAPSPASTTEPASVSPPPAAPVAPRRRRRRAAPPVPPALPQQREFEPLHHFY